ncbi:MAG: DNA repair protein RecN (Recombination protein N) [Halanaerobium sp. 4-GBenrich]|jgi:DNA repair protein RecN (Recombination protein N)|uniref:DNA repair protein RecN n=1 Tax=Halanaerobium congolense TaxID=54121 RepID=A0A1G6I1L7_9FIRM|nr:DNA repair protein RecN [Halanaerobium congolense]ODS50998.1 MAG: DNA repair protein RecN (Recombination protein N) [Halanaerobium sp. 4-GBenrich]TDP27113.1 DNA replication and repair protein RecN [Halanaerobium congolense]TDS33628.1 DNA replication and repair protein RecN [Halanaerobium congolense]TDX45348.1 DNA replication and repair protein RecN [Halanaerobium congolense]SDC00432.1 DNA replication and repair protein RecN [Halanaerobium congolense]
MLSDLQVKNFALINQVNINFKKGLNILSGETGAGKSIIIGALDLLLGARANTDVIRSGKEAAYISAFFQPEELTIINKILTEAGIEKEDSGILIAREIRENGRNRTLINGQLATLKIVKKISRYLIDIHGQHEHQLLLDPGSHLMILDAFIGQEIQPLKNNIKSLYQELNKVQKELAEIEIDDSQRARELDIINFQIDEIEEASLMKGEYEDLKEEYKSLSHAEEIYQVVAELISALSGDDYSEKGIMDRLAVLKNKFVEIEDYNQRLKKLNKKFADIYYSLEEFVFDLGDFESAFNYDEQRIAIISDRLDLINTLLRKYGEDIETVLSYLEELYQKRDKLENVEEKISSLTKKNNKFKKEILKKSGELSQLRKEYAKKLEVKLKAELKDLAMEDVRFKVDFKQKEITADGTDQIEFLISPNRGEDLKSLAKIASGGELSRIMLSLKTITAALDQVDTLIFDEVDSGVGGKTAAKMAAKLSQIAAERQIICITHLPQLASAANHHFLIKKERGKNRTFTKIYALDKDERVAEIARMIGGATITDKTLAHAEEMVLLAKD